MESAHIKKVSKYKIYVSRQGSTRDQHFQVNPNYNITICHFLLYDGNQDNEIAHKVRRFRYFHRLIVF